MQSISMKALVALAGEVEGVESDACEMLKENLVENFSSRLV